MQKRSGTKTKYPGVQLLAEGQYRVRGKVLDPRSGLMKEVDKRVEATSAKEAARFRDDLLQQVARATHVERMRVVDFAKSWIESKAAVVSRYTLEGYTYAIDSHVIPHLGNYYYDAVGHLEVQEMVNAWLAGKKIDGSPYARRSVKDWFCTFRNMTRDAMVHLQLDRDPTFRISFGEAVVDEERTPAQKLTLSECELLLAGMKKKRPSSYALLETKRFTGQRFCHVSALKWGDIDWSESLLWFRRKQVRGVVGPISARKPVPKEIPLLPELGRVLLAHGRRMAKLGYGVTGDDWVFPSQNGTLKQPSSVAKAIRRTAEEVDLKKRITPHMMRYLFNDLLRLAGIDQVTRKALTGHVTDEMTEHYSTVRLDERRSAMAAVAEKFREGKVGTLVGTEPKKRSVG